MPAPLPALNLFAAPGQRLATLDIAREIERRGFAGISVSSQYSNMAQCMGLAFATERIPFATAIAPIYAQTAEEFAQSVAYLHEVSGGRFQFGIGVAHAPSHDRMGVRPSKPLGDIRAFVAKVRSVERIGALLQLFSQRCANVWSRSLRRLPTAWFSPMVASRGSRRSVIRVQKAPMSEEMRSSSDDPRPLSEPL